MSVAQNGQVVETYSNGAPYQMWEGDRWSCPKCAAEVVIGFGSYPIGEHFQPDYARRRKAFDPMVVEDRSS